MASEITTPPPPAPLTPFIEFPKLPQELQLKIWKLAVPSPGIMQIRCIYPTLPLNLTQEERCDAESITPASEVEFGTDTIPSSLLRTCQQSRRVVLQVLNGCISSRDRKIRFNKSHDIIFLHSTHACCSRGLPGLFSQPATISTYTTLFKDVQQLALCYHALCSFNFEQLHSASLSDIRTYANQPWLISQFCSLRKFYLVYNTWPMELLHLEATRDGELFFQTFEEMKAPVIESVRAFELMSSSWHYNQRGLRAEIEELQRYKVKEKLTDWRIPEFERVGVNKRVLLGGDRWTHAVDWDWKKFVHEHNKIMIAQMDARRR